jgi:uncharacterized membrane protein
MVQQEWVLKRNCSLTPRQAALGFGVLVLLSYAVAIACVLVHRTWIVLGYATVEMFAVAVAFVHYARHATDHEHIALADDCLLIESVNGGAVRQTRLDPHGLRIITPRDTRDMIALEAKGVRVEVGQFVTVAKRRQTAQELRQMLQGYSLLAL